MSDLSNEKISFDYLLNRIDRLERNIEKINEKMSDYKSQSNGCYLSQDNFNLYKRFIDEKLDILFEKVSNLYDLVLQIQKSVMDEQKKLFEEVLLKKDIFRIIVAIGAFFTILNIIISIIKP